MSVTIRIYRESDRDALKAITTICFQRVSIDWNIERIFGVIGEKDWAWRKNRHIDADADANSAGIFVAEADGQVVGYITSRLDPESSIGWIPNLAVLPEYQGQGIAKRLMRTCLDYLRDSGMTHAKIETLAHNEVGSKFYPNVGFQEVSRQIHYVMSLEEQMNDRPVVLEKPR